jgi:hypothetical protein
MNGMKNELSSVNWQLEFKDRNVEQCWEIFKTRLIDCSEKYIPTRTVKGEKRQKWITREIIKLVRKKKDCGVNIDCMVRVKPEQITKVLRKNSKQKSER